MKMRKISVLVILVLTGLCLAASDAKKPTLQTQPSKKQLADAWGVFQRLMYVSAEKKARVEKLIGDLNDSKWKVRVKANDELSGMGPEIIPLVIPTTQSENLEVAARAKFVLLDLQVKADNISNELHPAIDTLAAAKDKKLIPTLIKLLSYKNPKACYTAEYALRRLTGKNFGYNSNDEPEKRAKAAERWRQWWQKNQASFTFSKKLDSFGILICDGKKLTAVSADGNVFWSRKLERFFHCATGLPNGNYLVGFDHGPKNVVEYDRAGKEIWNNEKAGLGKKATYDVQRLVNGNTLIAYTHEGYVSEITSAGQVVWQKKGLKMPVAAQRLDNGNTLICELHRGCVSEVDRQGKTVWSKTGLRGPYDAAKLPNGNVLIAETSAKRAIEVNVAGEIVWQCKCASNVMSVCRLPDGTTAIRVRDRGVILFDQKGRKIHQLIKDHGSIGRIRVVPAAVLKQKQPTTSSQPANIPLPAGRG
jgi:outer membrane protein assembly factor BamB